MLDTPQAVPNQIKLKRISAQGFPFLVMWQAAGGRRGRDGEDPKGFENL